MFPLYDDDQEVTFTAEEYEQMYNDPRFGYVCSFGHTIDQAWANNIGGCFVCQTMTEADLDW